MLYLDGHFNWLVIRYQRSTCNQVTSSLRYFADHVDLQTGGKQKFPH